MVAADPTARGAPFLPGYALFGALLAVAGLPIYIHAPKFFVDQYGVGLALLGAVLFALRLLDFVQEPALGWLSDRLARHREAAVTVAAALMALAIVGLFAISAPISPVLWFALTLTLLFSSFSFLSVSFYATGTTAAEQLGGRGHVRLAAWRETGSLLGVCVAAAAPTALMAVTDTPFQGFAVGFVILACIAVLAMRQGWAGAAPARDEPAPFRDILRDRITRRLLIVALLNAAPVAVSSTAFLFFVESRLVLPGWEGALLIAFFLSAAVAAPLWARAARAFGAKPVLLAGMVLSIAAFSVTLMLGPGALVPFALVCLASGAALGADMTLLPAIFAARLALVAPGSAKAFGLWSFATKFTLAVAAGVVLPALQVFGFQPGPDNIASNTAAALTALTVFYALLPCALKCVAIAVLVATPIEET
jgi:GPH family glycoside/pentoside/hexuronide:cation symporter